MVDFQARSRCPVCETAQFAVIYDVPYTAPNVMGFLQSHYKDQGIVDPARFADVNYVVAHCPTCDLLFQVNVPTEAMLHHIYSEMIEPGRLARGEDERVTLATIDKMSGEIANLFRLVGKPPTAITMLDYGFGYGRWARLARGMGAKVYATELGEEKRQIAASLGVEIIEDAAIDTMTFDIVHTEQVLEHLTEPGKVFARWTRACTGLLKVAVPMRGNAAALLTSKGLPSGSPFYRAMHGARPQHDDNAVISIQPLEHLNAFSAKTMRWLGDAHGLELISRVRMGNVGIDLSSLRGLARSLTHLGAMAGKAMLKPDKGYYLFSHR